MKPLVTLAMAVYGQPKMLGVWFDTLRTYSEEMLEQMELVIVDDHGTPEAVIPEDIQDLLPCKLYRVDDDIDWNQMGARNLAAQQANGRLILFVDPDMVFIKQSMEDMLFAGESLTRGEVIRFQLRFREGPWSGQIDASSPNTWFMHVADFKLMGCYDEDFAGHKGWSDVQLLDIAQAMFKIRHNPSFLAEFYGTVEIEDAMVTKIDRCTSHNRKIRLKKVAEARLCGGWAAFAKEFRTILRFNWRQIL